MVGKSPHAALAQRNLGIALAQNILRCHEKFFQSRRHAALQQDRFLRPSSAFQQRKVLHVPCPDLDYIRILFHQVERFVIDRLRDNSHSILLSDLRHNPQTFLAQALEGIWRGSRLVSSTAKELGSGAMHSFRHGKGLFAALNSARSSDNSQPRSADRGFRSRKPDDCVFFFNVAAYQLVRLRDFDYFLPPRHFFERTLLHLTLIASDANSGSLSAGHGMWAITQLLDFFAHATYLLFRSLRLH